MKQKILRIDELGDILIGKNIGIQYSCNYLTIWYKSTKVFDFYIAKKISNLA